jgi:hypothetical protein
MFARLPETSAKTVSLTIDGKSVVAMSLRNALSRHGGDATVHGFRSAFRDWGGERTNAPPTTMVLEAMEGRRPEQRVVDLGYTDLWSAESGGYDAFIPLAVTSVRGRSNFFAGLFNFDITTVSVPPMVLALQITAGLLVPLLAALAPVLSGTRITVREAIFSEVGVAASRPTAPSRSMRALSAGCTSAITSSMPRLFATASAVPPPWPPSSPV